METSNEQLADVLRSLITRQAADDFGGAGGPPLTAEGIMAGVLIYKANPTLWERVLELTAGAPQIIARFAAWLAPFNALGADLGLLPPTNIIDLEKEREKREQREEVASGSPS